MFLSTSEEIVLQPSELVALATFLRSETGARIVHAWAALRPPITVKGTSEEMHHAAGRAAGYEDAINTLIELTKPVQNPPKDPEAYPDIDNDDAWTEAIPN